MHECSMGQCSLNLALAIKCRHGHTQLDMLHQEPCQKMQDILRHAPDQGEYLSWLEVLQLLL
jgi:hypothetical protein